MVLRRNLLVAAAISGFVFVGLGALGAHALKNILGAEEMAWLHTGLNYQGIHTLAILALAVLMLQADSRWFYWSGLALALGIVLFSGSLYGLALFHWHFLVYITPIGGLSFLTGWVFMLVGALRLRKKG